MKNKKRTRDRILARVARTPRPTVTAIESDSEPVKDGVLHNRTLDEYHSDDCDDVTSSLLTIALTALKESEPATVIDVEPEGLWTIQINKVELNEK